MEKFPEDTHSQLDAQPGLPELVIRLKIPSEFGRLEFLKNNQVLELEKWQMNVISVLQEISDIMKTREWSTLSRENQGDIVSTIVPFASEAFMATSDVGAGLEEGPLLDGWTTAESREAADNFLASNRLLHPSRELVVQVLTYNLKPIFKSSPHPHLNVETGRTIAKAAGGPMAMQDYYEGQIWKQYPAVYKVILWCVRYIDSDAYETIWHLVIPPVMTLLDDYEAKYKLQGVIIVQEMLRQVPKDLLKRTGVGGLFSKSLRTSLSHLQSPETPALLLRAINASISLILLTTSMSATQPSQERFDQLSSLLGEGIITGIWLYSEDKLEVVKASYDALPALLNALGIGSARFLKALIPQLAHSLIPQPLIKPDRDLQLSAIHALETLLNVCKPRISTWKETILDGIGRCWVGCIDEERQRLTYSGYSVSTGDVRLRGEVKGQLHGLCATLADVCPSVVQSEYPRFLQADRALFQDLVHALVDVSS